MKILVIAATGNLGKAIVNAALRDGHDVSVLVRDGTKVPWNGEQLTKVYVSASGSLGDQVAIALAGDTFDAVALAVGAQAADAVRTTISDQAAPCPLDHVNRQFHAPAPNRLWVSDFTYVST